MDKITIPGCPYTIRVSRPAMSREHTKVEFFHAGVCRGTFEVSYWQGTDRYEPSARFVGDLANDWQFEHCIAVVMVWAMIAAITEMTRFTYGIESDDHLAMRQIARDASNDRVVSAPTLVPHTADIKEWVDQQQRAGMNTRLLPAA